MHEHASRAQTARVLVVDDDRTVRMLARQSLELAGFAVEEAEDGTAALSCVERVRPDIVLLDVDMPGLDGFSVCARLRERSATRNTPVLMMTGLDDVDSIHRAYEVGATDFITKPPNWIILGHRVRYMVRAHRVHERLLEREAQVLLLATAVEQSAEAIVVTDAEGTIRYANPSFGAITQYEADEVVGRNIRILRSGEHGPAFYRDLWETIQSGQVWTGRLKNRRRNGTVYDEECSISPVRDPCGRIGHFVAVKRDVTREVQLEARLRQTQKMEALGTLAGGIAHDFNNILSPIQGYAGMLLKRAAHGTAERRKLRRIVEAADRGRELVEQILTFSRGGEDAKRPFQPALLVKEVLKLVRVTLPDNVEVLSAVEPGVSSVMGDPTQIHQVLMNLFTNGIHAMGDKGGLLEVNLANGAPAGGESDKNGSERPGRWVRLTVRDTGCGMSPEVRERIFEPFFTTKDVGKGTGLGLAVVHGIVKGHGGEITVDTRPGEGTTFEVFLPAANGDANIRQPSAESGREGFERHPAGEGDETEPLRTS